MSGDPTPTSTAQEWEQRADLLHRHLLRLAAASPVVQREGRDGRLWTGSRETVLRDLWPNAEGQSRTHPYGGGLSRRLAGAVVKVGTEAGETVWWIALDRHAPARDPRQCPEPGCGRTFPSVQARRGHQASHRHGPRRLLTDADVEALATTLAARLGPLLAAHSGPTSSASGDAP